MAPSRPEVRREQYSDIEALTAVHADLVRMARGELSRRHLDAQLAEDLVQEAVIRWLTSGTRWWSERQARAWFRTVIRRMVVDRVRRPTYDVLDQEPFSLDDDWAHRWD